MPASLEAYYQEAGRAGRDGAAGARAAAGREPRQGAARALHQARRGRRRSCPRRWPTACRPWPTARGATASTPPSSPARSAAGRTGCARCSGHLARAGVIAPSPSSPDRVAGRLSPGPSTAGPRRPAGPRSRTRARARWRQYREIWAYVEEGGETMPAPDDPPPLRRPRRARAAARRSRLLRRSASRASCPTCRRRARGDRRPRRRDRLRRSRRPARGGAHHLRRDPPRRAHQEDRAQLLRRTARLRHLLPHAPRRHPRAGRRADRAGWWRPAAGPTPCCRCRDGRRLRRTELRGASASACWSPGRARTSRRSSTRSTAGTGSRWWASASSPAEAAGSSGRAPPGSRPRCSPAATYADRDARDAALGDWLDERGVRPDRARGVHGDPRRPLHPPLRGPDRQRPPLAAAGLPRAPGDRAGARLRRAGDGRDRPLRGRGRGQRPGHTAGGLRASICSRHRGGRGAGPRDRAPAAARGPCR